MLLPKDPYILLSFLNARLRDQYADLEDLCASLDADEQSLRETLAGVDYRYDPVYHQFIPITSKPANKKSSPKMSLTEEKIAGGR